VGVGVLSQGTIDILQSAADEFVVTDCLNNRVCVFSADGVELVRSWGGSDVCDSQFRHPTALAAAGHHLYVMDRMNGRVQVFE
jgi:hypothetical protein